MCECVVVDGVCVGWYDGVGFLWYWWFDIGDLLGYFGCVELYFCEFVVVCVVCEYGVVVECGWVKLVFDEWGWIVVVVVVSWKKGGGKGCC